MYVLTYSILAEDKLSDEVSDCADQECMLPVEHLCVDQVEEYIKFYTQTKSIDINGYDWGITYSFSKITILIFKYFNLKIL